MPKSLEPESPNCEFLKKGQGRGEQSYLNVCSCHLKQNKKSHFQPVSELINNL